MGRLPVQRNGVTWNGAGDGMHLLHQLNIAVPYKFAWGEFGI